MRHLPTALLIIISTHLAIAQQDQSQYSQNQAHHDWAYSGNYGPNHWAELDPDYASCNGKAQSPIDIITSSCMETPVDLEFHYLPFFVDIVKWSYAH